MIRKHHPMQVVMILARLKFRGCPYPILDILAQTEVDFV